MFVGAARLDIKPEHRDAFVAEMIAHAQRCLDGEPGTVRFEVIQDEADPNRIYVYEGYRDRAAFEAHLQGQSIVRFREATMGWEAGFARLGRGEIIFPPLDAQ
jgi:autoinducer 2-degrading protein